VILQDTNVSDVGLVVHIHKAESEMYRLTVTHFCNIGNKSLRHGKLLAQTAIINNNIQIQHKKRIKLKTSQSLNTSFPILHSFWSTTDDKSVKAT